MWNWQNASLREWYSSAATDQLIAQHPAVDGAFFDDFDGAVCPFESAYDELPSRLVTSVSCHTQTWLTTIPHPQEKHSQIS